MISNTPIAKDVAPGKDTPSQEIVLLVVDDHETYRRTLVNSLTRRPGLRVAAAVASGGEAVQAAAAIKPDVILMDINMPGMNGLEAMRRILANRPKAKVIVLSMQRESEIVLIALKAGAVAYICKDEVLDKLVKAIRTVGTN